MPVRVLCFIRHWWGNRVEKVDIVFSMTRRRCNCRSRYWYGNVVEVGIRSSRHLDAGRGWQMGRQEPASPVAEGIVMFHDDRMMVMVVVSLFVGWMRMRTRVLFMESGRPSRVVHGTAIEVVWTRSPALILGMIAFPSFALLYSIDELAEPGRTVKVVGHQWYWTYEHIREGRSTGGEQGTDEEDAPRREAYRLPREHVEAASSSGTSQADESTEGVGRRRLEADNRRNRPLETHIRLVITSGDVLHSWTVPSFGVKVDACPGRLNMVSRYVKRPGVYYGQCSEICGVNHGFIPIVVEVSSAFRGHSRP